MVLCMRGPMALVIAALLLAPLAQAGTQAAPDIVDPAGDVQYEDPVPPPHPCTSAVDLLSLWVEWTAGGVVFHYTFDDLAPVDDNPEQDFTGRCFYSYADFVLTHADGREFVDALYVDHWANPTVTTGWRFYLHETDAEGVGTVDIAAGTIDVLVPMAALGNPGPGASIGAFRVQSTTQLLTTPVVSDFATDLSPDGGPCDCEVPYPTTATTETQDSSASASSSPSSSATPTTSASSSGTTSSGVRPPQPAPTVSGTTTTTGAAPSVTDPPGKESPGPLGVGVAALLALLAVRRRLR